MAVAIDSASHDLVFFFSSSLPKSRSMYLKGAPLFGSGFWQKPFFKGQQLPQISPNEKRPSQGALWQTESVSHYLEIKFGQSEHIFPRRFRPKSPYGKNFSGTQGTPAHSPMLRFFSISSMRLFIL
jgi:hypothetical protein